MDQSFNMTSLFLWFQEKPLTKSLQRGEDPQFDQVSAVEGWKRALSKKKVIKKDNSTLCKTIRQHLHMIMKQMNI